MPTYYKQWATIGRGPMVANPAVVGLRLHSDLCRCQLLAKPAKTTQRWLPFSHAYVLLGIGDAIHLPNCKRSPAFSSTLLRCGKARLDKVKRDCSHSLATTTPTFSDWRCCILRSSMQCWVQRTYTKVKGRCMPDEAAVSKRLLSVSPNTQTSGHLLYRARPMDPMNH